MTETVSGAGPFVRVEDASLVPEGGPARLVLSHLADPGAVADGISASGGQARLVEDRLWALATPSRLVDAAGRAGGTTLAGAVERAVDAAVTAWSTRPPDLQVGGRTLPCSRRGVIMGIVNVTPDSFSDGGEHFDPGEHPDRAIRAGRELVEAGADLLDVGGESTRPGAEPVTEDEELRRIVPVIEALAGEGHLVSVDTMKATVARRAVEAGAAVVNDVAAGAVDGLMLPTVAELGVPYVAMHMRGTPRTMQRDPKYADVVAEVFDFLAEALLRVDAAGVPPERVVLDPGIGFGKTVGHNLVLLRRLRELSSLGRPVLVGTSRKSFLGEVTGVPDAERRLVGSVASAALAVANGAAVVRVHDVPATVEAVRVADAINAAEG